MSKKEKCAICGYDSHRKIGEKKITGVRTRNKVFNFIVRLVCCSKCGLVFQNPMQDPGKLEEYYSNMYREEKYRSSQIMEKQFQLRVEFACNFLETGQRVMEIGCADGTTLSMFRKRGMIPYGIEPSESNASLCKINSLDVFCDIYEKYPLGKDRKHFDLVCNYFVLEHVSSPVDFLTFCNNLLDTGGILCLEVPDIGAYELEESPADLLFFYEHQSHFTQETIDIVLRRCGFTLLEFADRSTHPFGMHLAARKQTEPLSQYDINVPPDVVNVVNRKVDRAQNVFLKNRALIRKKLALLTKQKDMDNKSVVIFGAGIHTEILLELPEFNNIQVKYIVDNNKDKQGSVFCSIPVHSPEKINNSIDYIVISSKTFEHEIFKQLIEMGIDQRRIVKIYS